MYVVVQLSRLKILSAGRILDYAWPHFSYLTYDLHAYLIILCYGKALKKEGTFVYKEITSYRGFEHRFKNHL